MLLALVAAVAGAEQMPTLSRTFVDSNIFLYAIDRADPSRRQKARSIIRELLRAGKGVISTQIAQEFYVIATKKLKVDPLAAKRVVELMGQFDILSIDLDLIFRAIDCSILSRISFWDALVVVAAQVGGCRMLLSEDLGHSQVINGVRVSNPFRE